MFGYEGEKSDVRTFFGGGYEVNRLLFKHGIDEGKLGDMRVLKVYYKYSGNWEQEGFHSK